MRKHAHDVFEFFRKDLTKRQREVFDLLLTGCTHEKASAQLFICTGAYKEHVYNMLKILKVTSRVHLMSTMMRMIVEREASEARPFSESGILPGTPRD